MTPDHPIHERPPTPAPPPGPAAAAFAPGEYALLDAGDGRRLERFGGVVVDRPAPAADFPRAAPAETWRAADLRYDDGAWTGAPPSDWRVRWDGLAFRLRPAAGGQVGLFPEQVPAWNLLRRAGAARVLVLFAHAGASTLAAAGAVGAVEVVHVDSARTAVEAARENAVLSGLGGSPEAPGALDGGGGAGAVGAGCGVRTRWLVEDATRFVERAVRRGERYDAIALDPPSFGRAPGGRIWKIGRDLPTLLRHSAGLLSEEAGLLLVSAHTPGLDGAALRGMVIEARRAAGRSGGRVDCAAWRLTPTSGGVALPAGACAWWHGG